MLPVIDAPSRDNARSIAPSHKSTVSKSLILLSAAFGGQFADYTPQISKGGISGVKAMTTGSNDSDKAETGRLKLLLVHDDKFTHELLGLFLRDTDFELISAFNAEEATTIIVSNPPDIVITDAMMPGESGFSLIDRIRARPSSARIPILLWTMLTQPDGSVMYASGKADILVNKPLYRSNMLEALERARRLVAYRSAVNEEVTVYVEQRTEHVEVII